MTNNKKTKKTDVEKLIDEIDKAGLRSDPPAAFLRRQPRWVREADPKKVLTTTFEGFGAELKRRADLMRETGATEAPTISDICTDLRRKKRK